MILRINTGLYRYYSAMPPLLTKCPLSWQDFWNFLKIRGILALGWPLILTRFWKHLCQHKGHGSVFWLEFPDFRWTGDSIWNCGNCWFRFRTLTETPIKSENAFVQSHFRAKRAKLWFIELSPRTYYCNCQYTLGSDSTKVYISRVQYKLTTILMFK